MIGLGETNVFHVDVTGFGMTDICRLLGTGSSFIGVISGQKPISAANNSRAGSSYSCPTIRTLNHNSGSPGHDRSGSGLRHDNGEDEEGYQDWK
jgi:hypothetical protein